MVQFLLIFTILLMFTLISSYLFSSGMLKGKILRNKIFMASISALPMIDDQKTNIDKYFMKLAIRHAQFAFREKEVPIGRFFRHDELMIRMTGVLLKGAVVVDETGQVVAAARNRVESTKDCTMHAEIDAVRKASKVRNNWRLSGCSVRLTRFFQDIRGNCFENIDISNPRAVCYVFELYTGLED